jgi:hypothetical protein
LSGTFTVFTGFCLEMLEQRFQEFVDFSGHMLEKYEEKESLCLYVLGQSLRRKIFATLL